MSESPKATPDIDQLFPAQLLQKIAQNDIETLSVFPPEKLAARILREVFVSDAKSSESLLQGLDNPLTNSWKAMIAAYEKFTAIQQGDVAGAALIQECMKYFAHFMWHASSQNKDFVSFIDGEVARLTKNLAPFTVSNSAQLSDAKSLQYNQVFWHSQREGILQGLSDVNTELAGELRTKYAVDVPRSQLQ